MNDLFLKVLSDRKTRSFQVFENTDAHFVRVNWPTMIVEMSKLDSFDDSIERCVHRPNSSCRVRTSSRRIRGDRLTLRIGAVLRTSENLAGSGIRLSTWLCSLRKPFATR